MCARAARGTHTVSPAQHLSSVLLRHCSTINHIFTLPACHASSQVTTQRGGKRSAHAHVRTLQHSPRQTPRRGTLTWSARCTRPCVQDFLAAMWHSCPTCTRCTLQTAPAESSAVHVPTVHSMLIWGVHIHIWGALGACVPPRSAWDAGEAPWWALAWTLLHGMRCGDSKRRPRWARRSARR